MRTGFTRVHILIPISYSKATRVDTDQLVSYVTPQGGKDKYVDCTISLMTHN